MESLSMMQSPQQKNCHCGISKPKLSLNIGRIKANAKPVQFYPNGEPMDVDRRNGFGLSLLNNDSQQEESVGSNLKKWDSFEVLENWCEKSVSEESGSNAGKVDNDREEDVNYFKDLVEFVEENGMDICSDKGDMDSFEMLEKWCEEKVNCVGTNGKEINVRNDASKPQDVCEVSDRARKFLKAINDHLSGGVQVKDVHEMSARERNSKDTVQSSAGLWSGFQDGLKSSTGDSLKNSSELTTCDGTCVENLTDNKVDISPKSPVDLGCAVDTKNKLMDDKNCGEVRHSVDYECMVETVNRPIGTHGDIGQLNPMVHSEVFVTESNNPQIDELDGAEFSLNSEVLRHTCDNIAEREVTFEMDDKLVKSITEAPLRREMPVIDTLKDVPKIEVHDVDEVSPGSVNIDNCMNIPPSEVFQIPTSRESSHLDLEQENPCSNSNQDDLEEMNTSFEHVTPAHNVITTFQPVVFRETNFIPNSHFLYSPSVPDIPTSLSVLQNQESCACESDTDESKSSASHSSPVYKGSSSLTSATPSLKTGSYNSLNSFSSEFSDLSKDMSQSLVFQEPNFSRGVLNAGHVTPSWQSRSSSCVSSPTYENGLKSSSRDVTRVKKRATKREIVDGDANIHELSHKLQKLSVDQSNPAPGKFENVTSSLKMKGVLKDAKTLEVKQSSKSSQMISTVKKVSHPMTTTPSSQGLSSGSAMSRSSGKRFNRTAESLPARNKGLLAGAVLANNPAKSAVRNNLQKCRSSPALYNRSSSPLPTAKMLNNDRSGSPMKSLNKNGSPCLNPKSLSRNGSPCFNPKSLSRNGSPLHNPRILRKASPIPNGKVANSRGGSPLHGAKGSTKNTDGSPLQTGKSLNRNGSSLLHTKSVFNGNSRGSSPVRINTQSVFSSTDSREASPLHQGKKTTAEAKAQLSNRQATPRYAVRPEAVDLRQEKLPALTFDDTDSTTTDDTDISEVQDVLAEKQRKQLESLRENKRKLHTKLRTQASVSPRCCSPALSSPASPADDYTRVRFKDAEAVNLHGPELEAVTKLYTLCNSQQQAKIIKQATAPMIFNATVCEVKQASRVSWVEDGQMVQEEEPSPLHQPTDPVYLTQFKACLKHNEAISAFPFFDEPFLPVVVRKLPKRGGPVQMDPSKM